MPTLFPNRKQWKQWSLPSKYSYYGILLSLLGLIIGIAPLITPFFVQRERLTDEFQFLVAKSREELSYADKCLASYKLLYWSSRPNLCPAPTFPYTKRLLHQYESVLSVKSYGELEGLKAIPEEIKLRSSVLRSASSPKQFELVEADGQPTLKDVWMEAKFLNWYLCWHDSRFTSNQCSKLPSTPTDDTLIDPSWKEMKTIGCPTNDFTDYLGCLD